MPRPIYLQAVHSRAPRRCPTQINRLVDEEKDSREMQTLLVMSGISFFILIIMVLSKFEMSTENMMNYAPMLWLCFVVIFAIAFNSFHFFKERRNAKRMMNRMNVEALLAEMALPQSFPCLLPGPHDSCCGGRGIVARPLPAYDELSIADETLEKGETCSLPPPDYSTAVTMLLKNEKSSKKEEPAEVK